MGQSKSGACRCASLSANCGWALLKASGLGYVAADMLQPAASVDCEETHVLHFTSTRRKAMTKVHLKAPGLAVCVCCCPVLSCHTYKSEDVNYDAFGRDLQSFFTELESLNSSLVLTADPAAGEAQWHSIPLLLACHTCVSPLHTLSGLCMYMACARRFAQTHQCHIQGSTIVFALLMARGYCDCSDVMQA